MELPNFTKGMGIGVLFILPKIRKGAFYSKKGEVGKILEEKRLIRENNLSLLTNFAFIYPRNITIQGISTKLTSFNIYPNF